MASAPTSNYVSVYGPLSAPGIYIAFSVLILAEAICNIIWVALSERLKTIVGLFHGLSVFFAASLFVSALLLQARTASDVWTITTLCLQFIATILHQSREVRVIKKLITRPAVAAGRIRIAGQVIQLFGFIFQLIGFAKEELLVLLFIGFIISRSGAILSYGTISWEWRKARQEEETLDARNADAYNAFWSLLICIGAFVSLMLGTLFLTSGGNADVFLLNQIELLIVGFSWPIPLLYTVWPI